MSAVVPDEGGRLRPTTIRVNWRSFAVPLVVEAAALRVDFEDEDDKMIHLPSS